MAKFGPTPHWEVMEWEFMETIQVILSKLIKEYCGLRSKMYDYSCEGKEDKRTKGVAKVVVKNELTL